MHYLKRAIGTLVVVAIMVVAGAVAFSLSSGAWMVTPVLSGSMRPGFSVGGVVVSQRVPISQITVRDVIVFENPIKRTEEMIHRIIKLTRVPGGGIKIKTQGDANPIPDPWTVTIRTKFVYRIRWSLPLLGYVAVAYQNHRGILVLVAGLLLVLVAAGTWRTSGARKRTRETVVTPGEDGGDGLGDAGARPALELVGLDLETFETAVQRAHAGVTPRTPTGEGSS